MAESPKVPLGNRPGVNWVEKYGALQPHATNWIHRAAEHLHGRYPDWSIGRCVATAKEAAEKLCREGDLNFHGVQHANAGSRAEACAAIATWNAARARAKAANLSASSDLLAQVIELAHSTSERKQMAKKGQALPGGRFPINSHSDVKKAVRAVGRARRNGKHSPSERNRVRRFIIRRAKTLGATQHIPSSWTASGALK